MVMLSSDDAQKKRAAHLSLAYNIFATIAKLLAAILTGSMGLWSEAAHGATDVIASLIAVISIRAAAQPPDDEHPYGHGKIESITGLAESAMLFVLAVIVIVESVGRFASPVPIPKIDLGLIVMAISAVSSFVISMYVRRIGTRTRSLALIANGQHLAIDGWTSLGILGSLAVIKITGWYTIDAISGCVFGVWMGFAAIQLGNHAVRDLIDHRMDEDEIDRIREILTAQTGLVGYHQLRTRHSGSTHYVDVHVVVPREWSVVQAHDLADGLEKEIALALPPAEVVVHVDPEPIGGLKADQDPD
jgi:cation diffusion facilitator family transporter